MTSVLIIMINWNETISLFTALDQQNEHIDWLNRMLDITRDSGAKEILKDERTRGIKARDQTRKILEQYYIHGITSDQLQKDIQP